MPRKASFIRQLAAHPWHGQPRRAAGQVHCPHPPLLLDWQPASRGRFVFTGSSMRTPFVAGNWKMNTDRASGIALARAVAEAAPDGMDVGVAPPLVYLPLIQEAIGEAILLGAQNCH